MKPTKESLIKEIEESKKSIKKFLNEKGLDINETTNLIKEILEGELKEIQIATSLYYIDGLSITEISEIMEKTETEILIYFQYILFRIKNILSREGQDKSNEKEYFKEKKGVLFDKKI